jgi:hypothetical protein
MIKTAQPFNKQTISVIHSILGRAAELANGATPTTEREKKFTEKVERARLQNPWFTNENIGSALRELAYMLRPESFSKWIGQYVPRVEPKTVGLILAGNIPMVGFHDVFCTLVSGHRVLLKPASQDAILIPELFDWFEEFVPGASANITWIDGRMKGIDAIIATGTTNTTRYFEYYFGNIPHIIRKNRNSVAILTGNETDDELKLLGADIFSYFGMGCRNVSKLYIHESFEINRFFESVYQYHTIVNHNKYANNYDYYRALWMMNREEILDNGFMILRPSEAISSPVGTVFYEGYSDENVLRDTLISRKEEIQCVVSSRDVPFGKSQQPELWDYADGADTMFFLTSL